MLPYTTLMSARPASRARSYCMYTRQHALPSRRLVPTHTRHMTNPSLRAARTAAGQPRASRETLTAVTPDVAIYTDTRTWAIPAFASGPSPIGFLPLHMRLRPPSVLVRPTYAERCPRGMFPYRHAGRALYTFRVTYPASPQRYRGTTLQRCGMSRRMCYARVTHDRRPRRAARSG